MDGNVGKSSASLYTVLNLILVTEFLGEVEKNGFIILPGKGGHSRFLLQKKKKKLPVTTPEDLIKGFITMVQG